MLGRCGHLCQAGRGRSAPAWCSRLFVKFVYKEFKWSELQNCSQVFIFQVIKELLKNNSYCLLSFSDVSWLVGILPKTRTPPWGGGRGAALQAGGSPTMEIASPHPENGLQLQPPSSADAKRPPRHFLPLISTRTHACHAHPRGVSSHPNLLSETPGNRSCV